jgi:hypothetical protein
MTTRNERLRMNWDKGNAERKECNSSLTPQSLICAMAEEEGFDFAQYEGGTRWHVLVCYTRNVETKGFTIFPHKHCFPAIPIPSFSVARRSTSGVAPFGNFCGN